MISVILPVYNGEAFIKETIESILNQTEENFELIIVNDGSTDKSEEVIKSFTDRRIRYFLQENKGVAAARNKGLSHCKGDFITFHDADDLSLKNRFEKLLEGFYGEDIVFVHSDMLLINEFNQPVGYWQSNNIHPSELFSFFINVGTPYNNGTIMYRKEKIINNKIPPYVLGEDTAFVMNIAVNYPSYHIPEPIYLYRRHSKNASQNNSYETLVQHIKEFLAQTEPSKFLKEIDWSDEPKERNQLKANLIVGVALSKRGLFPETVKLFDEAIPFITDQKDRDFFEGMKALVEKRFHDAENIFSQYEEKDHIIENYCGEALLHQHKYNEAYIHFLNALKLKADYVTPTQNLKAIGQMIGLNLVDKYRNKYY
ncbi:glycosyltransferase family 2 protein [Bacillus sp. SCS-151]|uniref:glycosyltransferase family 2 protein n=1 Tax=Nanhaiella sioensis TaxID=3115293 RepID=UPI00397DCBD9